MSGRTASKVFRRLAALIVLAYGALVVLMSILPSGLALSPAFESEAPLDPPPIAKFQEANRLIDAYEGAEVGRVWRVHTFRPLWRHTGRDPLRAGDTWIAPVSYSGRAVRAVEVGASGSGEALRAEGAAALAKASSGRVLWMPVDGYYLVEGDVATPLEGGPPTTLRALGAMFARWDNMHVLWTLLLPTAWLAAVVLMLFVVLRKLRAGSSSPSG